MAGHLISRVVFQMITSTLSGLSQNDFNQSLNFWDIGVSVSPGNDQIFNSSMTHTIDGVTVSVGMLQAHDYFDTHWGDGLDKSQGLQINFADHMMPLFSMTLPMDLELMLMVSIL